MNIEYDYDANLLYFYKKDNKYVSTNLYNIINLPLDLCRMIGDYYNCVKITLDRACEFGVSFYINDEYIDFKKIFHRGFLLLENNKYWRLGTYWINQSTIFMDNCGGINMSIYILNEYVRQIYKINDYFEGQYTTMGSVQISNNNIYTKHYREVVHYKVLDAVLFEYLIKIIKDIIHVYHPYKMKHYIS
jgi:hypothetical protein